MGQINSELVQRCRSKLLQTKMDLLNRFNSARLEFQQTEHTGDEIDQSTAQLQEHTYMVNHNRFRDQLREVESALDRIERGIFGYCEETLEPIEAERLLAIPWTRLSIEGAEIREAVQKRVLGASRK